MTPCRGFIRNHALLSYYLLVFFISWGAILGLLLAGGIPASKAELAAVLPVAIVTMLVGPSAAGLLMIGVLDGRSGFRELGSRLRHWRVGTGWYAIAIFLAPVLLMAVLLGLSFFSPVYLPGILTVEDKSARLAMGLTSAIVVGICEELGWMGFVTPRLRLRHGVLITGIIIGILWGAWHIATHVILASGAYAAPESRSVYIAARSLSFLLGGLVAFRVLMVWVYDHTRSLPLMMIMHASLTAANMIFEPEAIGGTSLYIYDLTGALAMWAVVVLVLALTRGRLEARTSLEALEPGPERAVLGGGIDRAFN